MLQSKYSTKVRRTKMNLSSRIKELRKKHETLSSEVEDAQRNPASDALQITTMKKRKLQIKEEITRLTAEV